MGGRTHWRLLVSCWGVAHSGSQPGDSLRIILGIEKLIFNVNSHQIQYLVC